MGVREDEICGRLVGDIEWIDTEIGRVAYLKIRDSKTASSSRDVPIHKLILDLGFLEYRYYGRPPDEPIFPELILQGVEPRRSGAFSGRFTEYRKKIKIMRRGIDFRRPDQRRDWRQPERNRRARRRLDRSTRMKGYREHRVPLSNAVLNVIQRAKAHGAGEFLFAGPEQSPLSNMAMLALLKRMGRRDITVHGFRSTFKDWSMEQTNFAHEVSPSSFGSPDR
jgi:integrase